MSASRHGWRRFSRAGTEKSTSWWAITLSKPSVTTPNWSPRDRMGQELAARAADPVLPCRGPGVQPRRYKARPRISSHVLPLSSRPTVPADWEAQVIARCGHCEHRGLRQGERSDRRSDRGSHGCRRGGLRTQALVEQAFTRLYKTDPEGMPEELIAPGGPMQSASSKHLVMNGASPRLGLC